MYLWGAGEEGRGARGGEVGVFFHSCNDKRSYSEYQFPDIGGTTYALVYMTLGNAVHAVYTNRHISCRRITCV